MAMEKSVRREIGIKRLKKVGLSYEQIGERIREFKNLGYVPNLHIDLPHRVKSEEVPIKKISVWQRIKTAIIIWFERLILRMKRR